MSFDRQLDILMAVLAAILAFVGSVFYVAISFKLSSLIAAAVFVAGILFGRRIAEIAASVF